MELYVQVTKHHSYDVVGEDESEAENVDEVEDALVIAGGPCVIPCVKVFLMSERISCKIYLICCYITLNRSCVVDE